MTADVARVNLERAYDAPARHRNCYRVLVDRLWPRGLSRKDVVIDEWNKDLAPTPALRKWFGHKAENWEKFHADYQAELRESEQQQRMKELVERAGPRPITLVYGAKDPQHNHAVVLAAELQRLY